jgi:hypothetical protein
MRRGICPRCKSTEGKDPPPPTRRDGLTDTEIRKQEHIQKQRKKQSIWVVPNDD